jgi:predicted esterase
MRAPDTVRTRGSKSLEGSMQKRRTVDSTPATLVSADNPAAMTTPLPRLLSLLTLCACTLLAGCDRLRGVPLPGSAPADAAPGRQVALARPVSARLSATIAFWLYLPPDYERDPTQRWPLVVYLHGSGERGSDLRRVKAYGPAKLIESRSDLPLILVSPQVPADGAWDPHLLHALLAHLKTELRIDADRVTATGVSMGGIGTWAWAIEYPDDLAGIAPVCGFGDEDRVQRIRHLPVWAFHGEADTVVPFALDLRTITELRRVGGQPRFTTYPGRGHDIWTPAYEEPGLFPWLLAQRRGR